VGYLCANLSLPRPLCSRLRPDVRDRQTDSVQVITPAEAKEVMIIQIIQVEIAI